VSTILKALQRLEDEKRADSERSLDEQIVARRPPPDPERRWLKIGAVAIGGLAVASAAFFFWPAREARDGARSRDQDEGGRRETPPQVLSSPGARCARATGFAGGPSLLCRRSRQTPRHAARRFRGGRRVAGSRRADGQSRHRTARRSAERAQTQALECA